MVDSPDTPDEELDPVNRSDTAVDAVAESDEANGRSGASGNEGDGEDDGPGWMPAILAGTLLMGIVGFIFCAFSTWLLFQKRTEFAARTLRGSYLPALEQSLLEPEDKKQVVARIDGLAKDFERGKVENWQAAGVMQRIQRLPVLQWGELSAIEGYVRDSEDPDKEDSLEQISRLRRSVELGKVTSFDFEDVLKPVLASDDQAPNARRLIQPLDDEGVKAVILRAKLVADRSEVPDKSFEVRLDDIVRREIENGLNDGGY